MKIRLSSIFLFGAGLIAILLTSCAPLISPYDVTAYQNATSLKAVTLALMDKAANPYPENEQKVDSLLIEIDKAYEYVRGIPDNHLSAQQWFILKKRDGDLLGKFFKRWKERNTLKPDYIEQFKMLVTEAFNEIICLEINKKDSAKCLEKGDK